MKISDVSRFKSWHSKRMGHPIGVILGIDAVSELESEVERLELNHGRMVEEIAELREALEKSSEVLRRQLSKYYYKDEVAMLNQYESNKKLLNQLKDRANGK